MEWNYKEGYDKGGNIGEKDMWKYLWKSNRNIFVLQLGESAKRECYIGNIFGRIIEIYLCCNWVSLQNGSVTLEIYLEEQ